MLQPVRLLAHSARFLSAVLLLGFGSQAWALNKVITVSSTAGRGNFTTIQAAVNNCDPLQDVCTIGVLDLSTTLEAPIWIEGKANITILGQTASGAKPSIQFDPGLYALVANPNNARGGQVQQTQVPKLFTLSWADISGGAADPMRPAGWLMWPYIGALDGAKATKGLIGSVTDTTSTYSSSGFQHNGMIVIKKSSNITIRGLKLISQPVFFQNTNVWNAAYDVLFGTIGINLMQSKAVTVDGNDISGFFSAIYNNGRNPGGMFGIANPNDVDVQAIVPLSRYGQVGNHNIERNYFHDNWWCLYGESIWDLASRIHHNVAYNNMNKSYQVADSLKVGPSANDNEMNNQTGGFYYMKDEVLAADRMYNNTILRSPIVIGFGYFRAGTQEMLYNNVFRVTPELAGSSLPTTSDRQLIQNYASTAWYNTVQQQPAVTATYSSTMDNQNIHDSTLSGVYAAGQSCAGGCNLAATYSYVSQVQPQFAWLNWQMAQGVTDSVPGTALLFNGKPLSSYPAVTGYAGRNFPISTNNGYASWGLVNAMTGGAAPAVPVTGAGAISRDNLFAFKLPTLLDTIKPTTAAQIKVDTTYTQATPSNVNNLSPAWDSVTVRNAVLNQAWYVDDQKNPDGTRGNRGAFCFDTSTGTTSLGCTPSGVVIALDDQKIVSVKGTSVQIPMIISQIDGATGAPSSGYSGFQVDSVYFYKDLPWGNLSTAVQTGPDLSKVGYPLPQRLSGTWNGTSGSVLSVTLPTALSATENVVRFDVFMSSISPTTGARVTTMGIYFYRQVTNQLNIQFCSDSACSKVITSARVGDKVYMKSTVTDASGNSTPGTIYRVYLSPNPGERNLLTGNLVDTSQFLPSFVNSFTSPLDFESTGNITVTVTGLFGSSTSTIGVVGNGSITIKPGLPYAVQFTSPETYQVTKCGGNPSDTTLGCNELQGLQGDAGTLVVYDKYGNTVDTAATVAVNIAGAFQGPIASPTALSGSSVKLGSTLATVSSGVATVNVQTDATGNATFYVYGDPGASAGYGSKPPVFPWVELTGSVQATYPVAPADSAYARLMPPTGHLAWKSPTKIDTFILTPMPVVLFLTKDGSTVDATNPNIGAYVSLAAQSSYIKFYADSAEKTLLNPDSIQLAGGQVRFWVVSTKPTTGFDTLMGQIVGVSTTNPGLPARFSNPPQPPTPLLKSAVFLDASCTGAPDSILVSFDPSGANPTLKTNARIDSITITSASGAVIATLDSTSVKVSSDSASLVITLPAGIRSSFQAYDPAAKIQITAALVRLPAADTIVVMNATALAVTDGIGPRPVSAAIVENSNTGTAPDTLKVNFSEPVKYTGGMFPFQIFNGSGTSVPATGLAVSSATGSGTNSLIFVVSGNTSGALAATDVLAIVPNTGLTDIAGNGGRYAQCVLDTALVVLQPVAVPVVSAWISDANGDGKADLITVVFRRPFQKASEAPDSFAVSAWPGAPATILPWSASDSIGPSTYTFAVSFPEGATVGGNAADGSGNIRLAQGPIRRETSVLVDSVPPVAVGVAKLSHGPLKDTLTVTVSEPVKAGSGTITLGKKSSSGADVPLGLGTASGTVLTFVITPGTVLVGDSLRMSITSSALVAADNGQAPAGTGNAPYIPVVGGDGIPDSAIVLDLTGQGTADAIRLVYAAPLNGNPSFTFTWGGKTITVDSTTYGKSLKGTTGGIVKVSGFPALVTAGPGNGTTQSLVAGSATMPLPFPLIDGVAPVLVSVYVTYGQTEGAPDTVLFKVSEPLSTPLPSVSSLLTINRNGSVRPFAPSDPTAKPLTVNSTTFQIVCDSCVDGIGFYGLPGFGDSAKLTKGVQDALGNSVADSSRWVPVRTGPIPPRYNANVYPSGGVFVAKDAVSPAIQNLPAVTSWILPVGADSTGTWTSVDAASNGGTTTLDAGTATGGLFGVTMTLNTSYDGQVLFYDNLGVFVGKADLKIDITNLQGQGLVSPANGKYKVVIALHDSNSKTLASGVYMARVISFSDQTVNGIPERTMVQNKLFKFGYKNTLK